MPDELLYDVGELLLLVGEGNERAFRLVFDGCRRRFYNAALRMTHSGDIAEEIVQEVFVNLWIKRKMVAAASNPESYLSTILHNSIYAHFRKLALERTLRERVGEKLEAVDINSVEEKLFAKENDAILESVVNQLPPQQRAVYKLSRQQGLTREQVAERLCISPNTVRNHLQQAVQFIRNWYKAGATTLLVTILQAIS